MRILGTMLAMVFLAGGISLAATIDLVDGRVIQGDIIKQDSKTLQVSVDGITMTYYADEIKDVDGKPFAGNPTASAGSETPAPEAQAASQPESASQQQAAPAAPESTTSTEGINEEKKALILKFIDVFGTRQALTNNFDMMLKQIEKEKPEEAEKIRQRVKIDEIIDRLLPVYDRNFSSEDLKAFIDFYGSAEGRKLIGTIPELMKESVQESIKYMQEKFPEVKQGRS
jgi:hypothetical protein